MRIRRAIARFKVGDQVRVAGEGRRIYREIGPREVGKVDSCDAVVRVRFPKHPQALYCFRPELLRLARP